MKPPARESKGTSIKGGRVRLRPLLRSDFKASVSWRNDPRIRDNILGYRFPVTEVMEKEWVAGVMNDQSRRRVVFAVEEVKSKTLLGFTYLNDIDWINRNADFGILIGDAGRHRSGFGRETCTLMMSYAFDVLNLHKVVLRVAEYNRPAISLYLRLGFVEEGRQRQQINLGGRWHDLVLMGLIRNRFSPRVSL